MSKSIGHQRAQMIAVMSSILGVRAVAEKDRQNLSASCGIPGIGTHVATSSALQGPTDFACKNGGQS
jgi:hypothetical protein